MTNYGTCVGKNLSNVEKDVCLQEFKEFSTCFKEEVSFPFFNIFLHFFF